MRTGIAFKWKLAAAAVVAVAGLAAADAGRPAPEAAPAPRPADPTRLIVGFAGHVRYLTPDGREVGRVTGDQVKAAGAEINTRAVGFGLGTRGPTVNVWETFAPGGRAAPDGRLPVDTANGLYLLAAGPAVAPVKAKGGDKALFTGTKAPYIAAWSPDGKKAIGTRTESRLFGQDRKVNTLIDLTAGTVSPLKLPGGHRVIDWAPDGTWFLTVWSVREGTWPPDWAWRDRLCRVSADGTQVEQLTEPGPHGPAGYGTISPDGTRVAYSRVTTSRVRVPKGEAPADVCNGFEVVVLDLATMTRRAVSAARGSVGADSVESADEAFGLRWSPDGTRLAAVSFHRRFGEPFRVGWRVIVCGADGSDPRTVLATDKNGQDRPESFTLLDWR